MKKKNGASGVKMVIIAVILVALVVGYYFYINHKGKEAREEQVQVTVVQNVLMRDMERNYPSTPKEVVRYFCEITQCLYNEDYTEEELTQLSEKIQEIYDDELIANKTQEQYLKDLKSEIVDRKKNKYTISGYEISPSTDVKTFTKDGYTCARLYATFRIRQEGKTTDSMEEFILRQDEEEHWKIYGWEAVDDNAQ